jgi:hypothetical protein
MKWGISSGLMLKPYHGLFRPDVPGNAIACIAEDWGLLRPAVALPRKTYDDCLSLYGLTNEEIDVCYQRKGYIDREILEDCFTDTLVPEVINWPNRHQYAGPAYLIMDHCSTHIGEHFLELCQGHDIIQVFITPHSSHLSQMLDVSLFGVTKLAISKLNRSRKKYVQMEQISDVVESFLKSSSPRNIVTSFRMAGISLVRDEQSNVFICVTPETAVLARLQVQEFDPSESKWTRREEARIGMTRCFRVNKREEGQRRGTKGQRRERRGRRGWDGVDKSSASHFQHPVIVVGLKRSS